MFKNKAPILVAGLLVLGLYQTDLATAEDRVDRNVTIMLEAARKLELSRASDGHAYLLVKQESVRASVAVIFGYIDNAVACDEIAEVLSNTLLAGTFKCSAIF